MSLPEVVSTRRLRLPIVTPVEARAALAGERDSAWHPDYPRTDDLDAFALVREGDTWGPRHVVRAWDGLVCGSIGFFGPPEDCDGTPETEVGYGLVAEARGHGLAVEALAALLVETDRRGVRIRASVVPENAASLRVLAACGFTQLRGANEDGDLVLVRPMAQVGSTPTPMV